MGTENIYDKIIAAVYTHPEGIRTDKLAIELDVTTQSINPIMYILLSENEISRKRAYNKTQRHWCWEWMPYNGIPFEPAKKESKKELSAVDFKNQY